MLKRAVSGGLLFWGLTNPLDDGNACQRDGEADELDGRQSFPEQKPSLQRCGRWHQEHERCYAGYVTITHHPDEQRRSTKREGTGRPDQGEPQRRGIVPSPATDRNGKHSGDDRGAEMLDGSGRAPAPAMHAG